MLSQLAGRLPYLLGIWLSFQFTSLQVIFILILRFLFVQVSPFSLMPFVSVGFIVGAVLANYWHSEKLYRLSTLGASIGLVILVFGMHFGSSFEFLFLYSIFLFLPFGHALTSGFFLYQSKKFYKYELVGSFAAFCFVGLILGFLSVEVILLSFLLVGVVLYAFLFRSAISYMLVLCSVVLLGFHLATDKLNFMTFVQNIEKPQDPLNPLRNGFKAIKSNQVELLHSKWSLGERIDAGKIINSEEILLFYNNQSWSSVLPHTDTNQGIFKYFPNVESALDIGAGGGISVREALNSGIKDVLGLEVNSAVYDLLKGELREFSGDIYKNIKLVEGRKFLESTKQKFDLITILDPSDLPDYLPMDLSINYFNTSDGIKEIYNHLNDDGFFVRRIKVLRNNSDYVVKAYFSVLSAIRNENESLAQIKERTMVFAHKSISGRHSLLMIVKKSNFFEDEIAQFRMLAASEVYAHIFGGTAPLTINGFSEDLLIFYDSFWMTSGHWGNQVNSDQFSLPEIEDPYNSIRIGFLENMLKSLKWYLIAIFSTIFLFVFRLDKFFELTNEKALYFLSFIAGLYVSMIQVYFIKVFEKAFLVPVWSFIVVYLIMIAGSALCATVWTKRSAFRNIICFAHPVIFFIVIYLSRNFVFLPALLLLLVLAFSASKPYIDLLHFVTKRGNDHAREIYLVNALGFSLGMFLPLVFIISLGNQTTEVLMMALSLVVVLLNIVSNKKFFI